MTCALGIALVSLGCVSSTERQKKERIWNEVRPENAPPRAAVTGTLVVYTAPDVHGNWSDGMYVPHYSDFEVRSQEDVLLKKVHNGTGGIMNRPVDVALAPGNYRIHARSVAQGRVVVPVIIKPGLVTTVHLDVSKERNSGEAGAN